MYKGIKQTGIVALGVGTFAYLCHRKRHTYTVLAEVNQDGSHRPLSSEPASSQHRDAVPIQIAQEGSQQLQLQQVQVMFRHGARTPLYLIPKIQEANYDPHFILREHQASLFPYERVLYSTGEPVEWSDYELRISETPLRAGVSRGTLTSYGKDQVYMLGSRLQKCYRDRLNMSTYSPQEVLVISSNIRRTVESARCVLAGFYGREHLQTYAEKHSPVKINIADWKYNILVPDTTNCGVLKKVNHASMLHSDFIPGFKSDRLKIEKQINEVREKNIKAVREIQNMIDKLCGSSGIDGSYTEPTQEFNEHHQPYLRDPALHSFLEERSVATSRVERLWADAMIRNPNLASFLTKDDAKALVYLRRLEVEKIGGNFCPGYRFNFYFDSNPYFHNSHLCKEIYLHNHPGAVPSKSLPIFWKENGRLLQERINKENTVCQCQAEEETKKRSAENSQKEEAKKKQKKPCTCGSSNTSFFGWYVKPAQFEHDPIGKIIRDEVWENPLKYFKGKSKYPDYWDKNFHYVFGRDDLVARATHGLPSPPELEKFESLIADHATTVLYCAMVGQHEAERSIVVRLCAGPLITAMVEECEKVMEGKQDAHKLCLYSSHDSTMSGLLELLGIWNNEWPPFAADVRLELYKDTNSTDYYVRVLYCGKVQKIRGQVKEFLPWSDFIKAVGRYLIHEDEYWRLCSSDVLERFAKDLLKHEKGEVVKPTEAPAGM